MNESMNADAHDFGVSDAHDHLSAASAGAVLPDAQDVNSRGCGLTMAQADHMSRCREAALAVDRQDNY